MPKAQDVLLTDCPPITEDVGLVLKSRNVEAATRLPNDEDEPADSLLVRPLVSLEVAIWLAGKSLGCLLNIMF